MIVESKLNSKKKEENQKGNTIVLILAFIGIILLTLTVHQRRYQYWPQIACYEVEADVSEIPAAIGEFVIWKIKTNPNQR